MKAIVIRKDVKAKDFYFYLKYVGDQIINKKAIFRSKGITFAVLSAESQHF